MSSSRRRWPRASGSRASIVFASCVVYSFSPSTLHASYLLLLDLFSDDMSQSDNYWLNTRTPALTYGLRGIAYFAINVSGPGQDLHSGLFGRMVHEPMTDLIKLMSKLVDHNGHILIPGIEAMVPPPDENEMCVVALCPAFVCRKA